MSNDLALLEDDVVALNKAFGYQGRPKPPIPTLKINGADEEEGKTAPKGTFVYDDGERILYTAGEIAVRSYTKAFQYRLFDNKNKDNNDMSIVFNDFRQELRSMSGRLACGKMNKKSFEKLGSGATSQQKYLQEMTKCKLLVFGVVTGTFTDLNTKKPVELKDALFSWVVSQSGYMAMDAAITGLDKERRPVALTPIKVTLKKDKQGSVTYFSPVPVVQSNVEKLDPVRDADYLSQIQKFIKDTNDLVNERFNEAVKGKQENDNFATVSTVINNATPNDEIPF